MKPDWFLEIYLFDNMELNSNDFHFKVDLSMIQ